MTLATIQQIISVNPIPGADNISVAQVLGWQVVVAKKDNFQPGDLCIYIEIDSLIPNKEWSKFLFREGHENDEYYRLRTIKLRKQISQGLVLPLDILEGKVTKDISLFNPHKDFDIDNDVTELLGIKKYEKVIPANLRGTVKGDFPPFLRKTDEIRIQSKPELLEELKGKPYYITTKMDGTSVTIYKYKGVFGVCSRNLELKDPRTPQGFIQWIKREIRKILGKTKKEVPSTNLYWKMALKYNLDKILPEGYAVQGEICGPGIQENKIGLTELNLFIFNLFDINKQKYLFPQEIIGMGENIQLVPSIESTMNGFNYTQEQLLEMANNLNYPNDTPAEGIVVRSLDQSISFKVISNRFLLKYGE